jgi:hypothetical protein
MRLTVISVLLALLLAGCDATSTQTQNQTKAATQPTLIDAPNLVYFAAVGDMPYNDKENTLLTAPQGAIVAAIRAYDPPVLIHFGDLKSGAEPCTDALFVERQKQIAALLPHKTVYTPGDNDWTDCDRDNMNPNFDELERLTFISKLFYQGEGLKMTRDIADISHQTQMIENTMWSVKSLAFGTLHIVGTNNGRYEILKSDVNLTLDAADRRDALNIAWIKQLFASAANKQGLVITFQADMYRPGGAKYTELCTAQNRTECDGFKLLREAIAQQSALFNKPVLVIHGDTNAYCLHHPSVETAAKLWRLNGLGDFKFSDAVQVTFDPDNADVPFTILSMLGQEAPPSVCDYSR